MFSSPAAAAQTPPGKVPGAANLDGTPTELVESVSPWGTPLGLEAVSPYLRGDRLSPSHFQCETPTEIVQEPSPLPGGGGFVPRVGTEVHREFPARQLDMDDDDDLEQPAPPRGAAGAAPGPAGGTVEQRFPAAVWGAVLQRVRNKSSASSAPLQRASGYW